MGAIPIGDDGRFAGYASLFNRLDSGGDVVMPGAFAKSLARRRDRIRLLFQHALREPGFDERIGRFREGLTEAARREVDDLTGGSTADPALAGWAARTATAATIEAVLAWLDAGQPDPGHASDRVRRVALGVLDAALPVSG